MTEIAVQSDIINTLHWPAIEIVVPRPKLSKLIQEKAKYSSYNQT